MAWEMAGMALKMPVSQHFIMSIYAWTGLAIARACRHSGRACRCSDWALAPGLPLFRPGFATGLAGKICQLQGFGYKYFSFYIKPYYI